MSDLEIHMLCSKFDINILEEASYVLWNVWRAIHPKYSTLQACISALTDDVDLYQALKLAHGLKKYDTVRDWISSFPGTLVSKDSMVQTEVEKFLNDLRPSMTRLVSGEIALPLWTPDATLMGATIAGHLEALRIPYLNGKPNVLLHDLGSFKDDPALAARLKNIFISNHHTFLVNTSGSGKTRLLLEGLCNNWGFYFTSLIDSALLGSSDVQNSIRSYIPDSANFRSTLPPVDSQQYESALNANRQHARRIFRRLFLARLFIFDIFIQIMNEFCPGERDEPQDALLFKQRWLLLQLQPSILRVQVWDIFDDLMGKLSPASESYVNATTKTLLVRVRKMLSERSDIPFASQDDSSAPGQAPLFCVLDEAQYAATQHLAAFRSDHGNAHRPILREIVRAWEGQSSGHGVFMVVAGTGISKDVVDQAMASAIMKESKYRWCSDTGAFDDVGVQRRYLERYFSPTFISSKSGVRLMERIWYWLRGRHRFTAGYVAELLNDGFRRPHTLLNTYIKHFTRFDPADAAEFTDSEGSGAMAISSRYKIDFRKLSQNPDMMATVYQLTTHYMMRSVLPFTLGKDEATYVEYGFARFADATTHTVLADEPLVLLAAAHWTDTHYRSAYKLFAKQIHMHEHSSNGFENFLAFCLGRAFATGRRRIDEVFTFCGSGKFKVPGWVRKEAELVALYCTEEGVVEVGGVRLSEHVRVGPSVTLGANAKSTGETRAWLEHRMHSPLCFPHPSMGPDLLFVLRTVEDGALVWVALQAKYSTGKNGMLSRFFLRRAMRSVTPAMFFVDKDGKPFSPATDPDLVGKTLENLKALPHRRTDGGKYSLLRVVASFPAQTNLKRCIEEDPDDEGHPIACLNMKFIKQLTRELSPVDFLEVLEKKSMPGVTGKRTREVSVRASARKRLKI